MPSLPHKQIFNLAWGSTFSFYSETCS